VNTYTIEEADAITAVSKFMANEAHERLGIERGIHVIPNFVDSNAFSPNPCEDESIGIRKDLVIAHVSNFRPVKRVHDLVYAMAIIKKEVPDVSLMLIGDGPDRHSVEMLIKRLNLKSNIVLTGFRSDVAHLLRCSDVVVLCSETESAPLTLLEGMSCGLPVIATNVGGIPEIIQDGINGFLVPSKNPEAIAEKLLKLNANSELRKQLGTTARETVLKRYTADKVVDQYLKIFESIV
jgi:N-acetyl-alpha-D-glucosaminyl L-malate synthase BshA